MDTFFLTATFDVQNATVEEGSDVEITVHFITNSLAMGCLVVLQSNSGSPDELRVLLWNDTSGPTVTDMISVPPSTYTLYVYDLEEDGHVNREPAILPEDRIHVTANCKLNGKYVHCNIITNALKCRTLGACAFYWGINSDHEKYIVIQLKDHSRYYSFNGKNGHFQSTTWLNIMLMR